MAGRVRFEPALGPIDGTGDNAVVLTAGDVAQWRHDGLSPSPQRLRRDAADALAWRSGNLVFSGDTLPVVAEQLGRYAGVALDAAALRDSPVRITAVVQLRDAHAFVHSLPQLAPVRLDAVSGGGSRYRLRAR
jgi:ferric-dicitrate binding protein FerR (iron transport regulator)